MSPALNGRSAPSMRQRPTQSILPQTPNPGSETYYLKQAWGAFGAAYRSQLFDIGIFDPADDHDIPLPSKPSGENLAQAFADSLGDLASVLFAVIQRGTVTKSELDHLVPAVPSGYRMEQCRTCALPGHPALPG